MRTVVLTDIHGNIHALEAVLDALEHEDFDELVIAGDSVNVCPHSRRCWNTVSTLNCAILNGNHERYVYDYETQAEWHSERFLPSRYTYALFTSEEREVMRALPLTKRFDNLLISHATPDSDEKTLLKTTPEDELKIIYQNYTEAFFVRGHNHSWFTRTWQSKTLYSLNALGLPLDGNHKAPYAVLEQEGEYWTLQQKTVRYDVNAAIASFDGAYIAAAGPIARLHKRELETARWQVIPFFREFGQALESGELTLAVAVEKYLGA